MINDQICCNYPSKSNLMQTVLTKIFNPILSTFTITNVSTLPDKHNQNSVGQLFWPLVFILKILGNCALSYEPRHRPRKTVPTFDNPNHDEESNQIKFKFKGQSQSQNQRLDLEENDHTVINFDDDRDDTKEYRVIYRSKFFIWSAILAIIYLINWTIVVFQTGFGVGNSAKLTYCSFWMGGLKDSLDYHFEHQAEIYLNGSDLGVQFAVSRIRSYLIGSSDIMFILIPLLPPVQLLFSWIETSQFAKFLNNWKEFEFKFSKVFPPHKKNFSKIPKFELTAYRNRLLIFYVFFPTLFMQLSISCFNLVKSLPFPFWIHLIISLPFALQIFTATLLEDIKILLTYRTIADAFSQINQGIAQSAECKGKKLTAKNVRSWRKLVDQVKRQSELAGRYQRAHQLFLIATYIVLLTAFVFVLLHGARSGAWAREESWKLWSIGFIYVVVLMGRLYAKVMGADRITKNESLIARQLSCIGKWDDEPSVQQEIKFLHDMIKQSPTVISFGNFVTLRKKLILGIASQIVTYLIVLMQLSQSQNYQGSVS